MNSNNSHITGRFAPSPTGRMHLGNVFSALLSWLSARSRNGEWILRIEDLDRGRCRPEYTAALENDLRFLGLDWDRGGSEDVSGLYCQSNRGRFYEEALSKLRDLTYPCWCSKAEIMASSAPHESDGRVVYPGTCRDNEERRKAFEGRPAATRLIVPNKEIHFTDRHYGDQMVNLADHCGDFIVRRSDGAWAYQLAVVVDDALMGVTEVVRGRDLLLSSAQQKYLFEQLGCPVPEFCHFPLLCNADGQRLSKRDASLDMGQLRKNYTAAQITGILAFYAGLTDRPEACKAEDLLPVFDWKKVPLSDIVVSDQSLLFAKAI